LVLQAAASHSGSNLPSCQQNRQSFGLDGLRPIALRSSVDDWILPSQSGCDGPGLKILFEGSTSVAIENLGDHAQQLENLAHRQYY